MNIRFTAKSDAARELYLRYVDKPAKEIKKIRVFKKDPLIVDVTPRFKGLQSVMIKRAIRKPQMRAPIEAAMNTEYAKAMRSEGLKPEEYDVRVMWDD